MKNFIFLFCFLFTSLISAQEIVSKEALLMNKDISWVGEYQVVLPFDMNIELMNGDTAKEEFPNAFFLKKQMDIENPFAWYLIDQTVKNNLVAYKDFDLKVALNKEQLKEASVVKDTVMVFDPETLIENERIITNNYTERASLFHTIKVNFLVYFNSKTLSWHQCCSSICPLRSNFKNEKFNGYTELFWIPVHQSDTKLDYTQPNFTYANQSELHLDFTKAKVLKNTNNPLECNEKMISDIKTNPSKHKLFMPDYVNNDDFTIELTKVQKENLGKVVDTILWFNPETSEEGYKVKIDDPSHKELW